MEVRSDEELWFGKYPKDPRETVIMLWMFQEDLFIFNEGICSAILREIQQIPKS